MDKETQNKLQEMQIAEQNLQNLLMQKQAFQIELNEISSSEDELKKAEGDIYKIAGNVMIKAKKHEVEGELKEKKEILALRIKTIERQEDIFKNKIESAREDIEKALSPDKKK